MPEPGPVTVGGVEGLQVGHGPIFAVIGVFDGLHLGHQYLLRHLVDEADRRGAKAAVITFDAHPDEVILGAAPPLLLDPADRRRLLGEAGVDVVVVQHFDAALRETEYDDFIHRITSRTRLAGLLMTPDAAFGHDRRGTAEAVTELGGHDGFDVVVVEPLEVHGHSVRSSDIRAAIAEGDLWLASDLLGRPYALTGTAGADGTVTFAPPRALPHPGIYIAAVKASSDPVEIVDVEVADGGVIVGSGRPPVGVVEISFVDADALDAMGDLVSERMLLRLADAHDPDLAVAAIVALRERATEAAWERIEAALSDRHLEVRVVAADSLANRGGDRAASALADRLSHLELRSDAYELDGILLALARLADPRSEAEVSRVLESGHAHERSHVKSPSHGDLAAKALDAIGTPSALAAADAWRKRT